MFDSLWLHGLQHTRLPCPSPSPRVCSNSCLLSQWCHPSISCSVAPFSSCLQSFPSSGSFPVSKLFASGGQWVMVKKWRVVWNWISSQNLRCGQWWLITQEGQQGSWWMSEVCAPVLCQLDAVFRVQLLECFSETRWPRSKLKTCSVDFPGGLVVESTCQCRSHRFDPWSRKIPHASEQLSLCTTTAEPVL